MRDRSFAPARVVGNGQTGRMSNLSVLERVSQRQLGLQRLALRVLIASVVVSAAMGVFALLVGEFGDTQSKLLLTSLCVSGAAIEAMACGFALERGRLGSFPLLGIATGIAGFGLLIGGLWADAGSDPFWRSTGTVLVLAAAATHACVVSPFGLVGRFRWVFGAAYALNALVTALVVIAIWSEPEGSGYWRFLGAVAILLAAATIAIPVLRRLGEGAPRAAEIDPAPAEYCPRCGEPLVQPGDRSCPQCGSRFRVMFRR